MNVNGAQPVESACVFPYLTKLTDPAGDQTGGPTLNTQEDIHRVAIGEPFVSCVDRSLTFVMKVQTLAPAVPPGAAWMVTFNAPGTTNTLFVQMDTQTSPTPGFNYGYFDGSTKVVQCGRPNVPSCPITGSYLPNGTIVMKVDTVAPLKFFSPTNTTPTPDFTVDLGTGAALTSISGITQMGTQSVDTTATSTYTTAGNLACLTQLPVAVLSAAPLSGPAPLMVNFDASQSSTENPCAAIVSYTLDFGDGSPPVTQASPFFAHTYSSAGNYPARLTVTDAAGQVSDNLAQIIITVTSSTPQLVGVVSRKTHGLAGTFDINLPLTGTRGVECRSGGANNDYTLIFTFPNTLVSVGGVTLTGIGSVTSSAIGSDTHQYIVNLTGVTSAQNLLVTLNNVQDSGANVGNVSHTMGVLVGDTTANGSVNSSDIGEAKSQSGQAVTATNFRTDVTVNGFINTSDIGLVKSASGTSLPPTP